MEPVGAELVEFLGVVSGEEGGLGEAAVLEGVLGGFLFAFWGAGPVDFWALARLAARRFSEIRVVDMELPFRGGKFF